MRKFIRTIREFVRWANGLDWNDPSPVVISLVLLITGCFVSVIFLFFYLIAAESWLAVLVFPGIPAVIAISAFIDSRNP